MDGCGDWRYALAALRRDDKEGWLHQPFHDARALRAMGLAFLLGGDQRFNEVADAKTAFLAARVPLSLEAFLRLREELAHHLPPTTA